MPRTVAVTGSTGFVGRAVVRALLDRGCAVRALTRDRAKARDVLPMNRAGGPLTVVEGEALSARAVGEVLAGADACIHLIGIIRERTGQSFRRAHVDAANAFASACRNMGVRRFIHMSALGASDEGACTYQTSKFEGERMVRRAGLDWTIFRPGMIHGPDGEFINTAVDWASGHVPPYFFLPYFTRWSFDERVPLGPATAVDPSLAPVFVGDVARAFVEALDRPETIGEIYALVGAETLTWPDFLREVRDRTPGSREGLIPWGIPSAPAAAAARIAGRLGLGGLLPFDEGMARMGAQDSVASLDKFRAHLGFTPGRFRDDYQRYAGAMVAFPS